MGRIVCWIIDITDHIHLDLVLMLSYFELTAYVGNVAHPPGLSFFLEKKQQNKRLILVVSGKDVTEKPSTYKK